MAASTLISNIPSERSSLKKTDGKQKVKDVATVQVTVVIFDIFSLCTLLERSLYSCWPKVNTLVTNRNIR